MTTKDKILTCLIFALLFLVMCVFFSIGMLGSKM